MVHHSDITESELHSLVSLLEEHTHKCAVNSSYEQEKPQDDHFSEYWNMMDTNTSLLSNKDSVLENCGKISDKQLKVKSCVLCNSVHFVVEDGFNVCQNCGTLGRACIESDAEWRMFSKDETRNDSSRCGEISNNYLTVNDQAEGTLISCKWKESAKMRNARQYHKWNSCNPNGRNLYVIFDELQRHAQKNGFNQMIIEDTKHLYKVTTEYHLFRGMNRKGLYAYCLYHTCKKKNVPRSIKEISKIFGLDPHVMTKGHTAFNKVLREHETIKDRRRKEEAQEAQEDCEETSDFNKSTNSTQMTPSSKKRNSKKCSDGSKIRMLAKPTDFIDRFCSKLNIAKYIVDDIYKITLEVSQKRLVSDNPSLITSACMLVVFTHHKLKFSSADIQHVSSISHVTIDKCYKKLMVFYDALEPCMNTV